MSIGDGHGEGGPLDCFWAIMFFFVFPVCLVVVIVKKIIEWIG